MSSDKSSKVQLPNRLASALGYGTIYGFVTSLVMLPINVFRTGRAYSVPGKVDQYYRSPVTWGLAVIPLVAVVTGWVKGWGKASAQRDLIQTAQNERDVAIGKLEVMEKKIENISSTLGDNNNSTPKEHPRHTDRLTSYAQHGSHAEAALNEKRDVAPTHAI